MSAKNFPSHPAALINTSYAPMGLVETVGLRAASAVDFMLNASAAALRALENRSDAAFAIVRVLRAGSISAAIASMQEEWRNWVAAGYIRSDYAETTQARENLTDLLEAYASGRLNGNQMELLRKIYLVMASESISNRADPRPAQFLETAQELSVGEILVLFSTHQLIQEKLEEIRKHPSHWTPVEWAKAVAERTGLIYSELVELHEPKLVEKRLLVGRMHSDNSGFKNTRFGNLTEFGNAFCEFVHQYDVLSARIRPQAT